MKLASLLSENNLILNLRAKKKEDALKEMVSFLSKNNEIDEDEVYKGIIAREEVMSTGLGGGVAIPHTKADSAKNVMVVFARVKDGVDFKSIDQQPVYLIFMVIVPSDATISQIKILARISRLLKHNYIRERLKVLKTKKEILNFIAQEEERHLPY